MSESKILVGGIDISKKLGKLYMECSKCGGGVEIMVDLEDPCYPKLNWSIMCMNKECNYNEEW